MLGEGRSEEASEGREDEKRDKECVRPDQVRTSLESSEDEIDTERLRERARRSPGATLLLPDDASVYGAFLSVLGRGFETQTRWLRLMAASRRLFAILIFSTASLCPQCRALHMAHELMVSILRDSRLS